MPRTGDARARAVRRASWHGRILRDGAQDETGTPNGTAAERLVAAWTASQAAAAFAGGAAAVRSPRAEWPGEVRRSA